MAEIKTTLKSAAGAFVLRYRIYVLASILVACAVFMVFLKDVKLDEDPMASMYPAGHPFLKGLGAIEKMAPRTNMLVALLEVKSGDIYNSATIKRIDEITKGLMDCEVISSQSVTSLTKGMDNYEYTANGLDIVPVMGNVWPETPGQFTALKSRVATNPMGPGKYVSYDGKAAMITASLMDVAQLAESSWRMLDENQKTGLTFEKYRDRVEADFDPKLLKKLDELRGKVNDKNHELLFMGEEVIKADMTRMGMTHMPVAGGVMLVLMIAFSAVYFRSWQSVFISVFALIFPAGAGLGLYSLLGMSLNPMAVLFQLVVAITSVSATLMVLDGYYRSISEGKDESAALGRAWGNVPAGLVIAAAVSISMLSAKVSMLRQLGILGAASMVILLAVAALASPLIASILPPPKTPPRSWQSAASSLSPTGAMKFVAAAVLIGLFILGGKPGFGDNTPGSSYLWGSNQWNKCFRLFTDKFMGPNQLLVYVKAKKEGGLTDPEALQDIGAFSNYLKYRCGAKDVIAFDYMLKMARYTMSDGSPKWQTLPENGREGKGLGGMVTENSDVREFIDSSFTQASISPFFPKRDRQSINLYAGMIQDYIDSYPSESLEFSLGGGLLGMVKLMDDGMLKSFAFIVPAIFVILLVLTMILLRSFKKGFYAVFFALTGNITVFMLLNLFGMPLSMPILTVMASGTGLALVLCVQALDKENRASVLFSLCMILLMSLPWFFIGMRFQALMIIGFAVIAVSGGALALVFYPMFLIEKVIINGDTIEEVKKS